VTLRNRIAMSPMTMYRSVDGKMGIGLDAEGVAAK
jgi:2,4-dienoyl-CoA reductase-like NADH-dependent reductase (Old Yellow Enzyme family)